MNSSLKPIVCIVTPDYLASTPRVVKEATALAQDGCDVRVVCSYGNLESIRNFDETLTQGQRWRYAVVGWSSHRAEERWLYWKSAIRQHVLQRLPSFLLRFGKALESAEGRVYAELARLAAKEKADLYIGHYPVGLAAAAFAASRWKAELRYDAEDLHTGEQPAGQPETPRTRRIRLLETRYLARCSKVTAASELIADQLASRYGIARPLVIHNVFPWSDRTHLDGQMKDRQGPSLSLCWFSQTIGEDRGIEEAIRAVGLLHQRAQLHLRGFAAESVKNKFRLLAKKCHLNESLYFHPAVPPGELLSRTAEHDVGLSLEQPHCLNREIAVTNKLFLYFLAGLAVAATDVPGQRYVMATCPQAGALYPPGDVRALAEILQRFATDSAYLDQCKKAALKAAQEQWNWERESQKLVAQTVS